MAVGNDSVEHDLVEVRCFESQHLKDGIIANLIRNLLEFRIAIWRAAKSCGNEIFTVSIQKIKCWQVSTRTDLDDLCKAIADLSDGQSTKKSEVKECVDWRLRC